MKKLLLTILIILGTLAAYGKPNGENSYYLSRAVLTNEVVEKEPVKTMDTFKLYSQGYFYTEFKDIGKEKTIYHNWYLLEEDGEKTLMASVPLKISGPRWRTWSRKNLFLSGKWSVEAVDENDKVLSKKEFNVE
ncbi:MULTISPECIES: DUF2914 domain-containing protein [Psychrilyobacter]|uniref:DUF2914 domain-containing protein n=1 Tax=Psychrilyobacter piezotolerans TaxID=2293438 RepID=A0ABX9KG78_9FUSO|nr:MULTISPECIES: DUF2914 domain-containing protein [Psychrilyobacter]MCS5420430.1 DUF2914 domain-containing protein [Psychrilyobacter sp. S5]NDI78209.1 DUF2914 domain-containing protein [Psychrilyobacter piezotolerans]RDE61228.1 DUF2914 domain-containing protein [Psychrilyobacter sp. S5]REI40896.1 DUF2914 domain-containing protein [Psychrilyobacter piezotolerans]